MIASDSEIDLDDHSDLDSDFDDDGDMYDSDNDANSDHNGSDSGRLSNDDSDNDCGDHNSKKKKTRMLGTKSQKLEKRNDISNDKVKTGSKGELNISKQTENSTDVLNDDAANTKTATKYVPPHLRKLQSTSKSENDKKLERLKKMLKGLINRYDSEYINFLFGPCESKEKSLLYHTSFTSLIFGHMRHLNISHAQLEGRNRQRNTRSFKQSSAVLVAFHEVR